MARLRLSWASGSARWERATSTRLPRGAGAPPRKWGSRCAATSPGSTRSSCCRRSCLSRSRRPARTLTKRPPWCCSAPASSSSRARRSPTASSACCGTRPDPPWASSSRGSGKLGRAVRRADRLFRIVQRLRRRGVTTARALAEDLGVSERTVYRDVRDLVLSGVPVLGEAGVGYALPRGYDLPPLMFNEEEIEALVLGARVVQSWADPELRAAAGDVLAKVEAVLPPALRERLSEASLFSPGVRVPRAVAAELGRLRTALRERRKSRSVAGYCELRKDFRNFSADRVAALEVLEERFEHVPGRTLRDLIDHYQSEERP